MRSDYKICSKCVMDTSDKQIKFDARGVCNHCKDYSTVLNKQLISGDELKEEFTRLAEKIKMEGKGKEYDCVIGLSGGVDSSYLAYVLVKAYGLRPLAVHLDNGWDSKLAVKNIQNIVSSLDVDLYTHVINWEEFRDIQIAYFKASVLDIEAITDHAISAILYSAADTNNIKYILMGTNRATERILPKSWAFNKNDLINLRSIHKEYGKIKLKTFPQMGFNKLRHYRTVKKISNLGPLDYLSYNKDEAKNEIQKKLKWEDYGAKHHESVFTRFYQGYILPKKFGIDKRRAHLSSLINCGQMIREEALEELKRPVYPLEMQNEDYLYVIKKLGFSKEDFERIMKMPVRSHFDFPTDIWSKIDRKYISPSSILRRIAVKYFYRKKIC
jgi:N-acetyl sugar amidotransferase